jgi:hypothetical protein
MTGAGDQKRTPRRGVAPGLAVDCWDWPVAYPQIRDERAAPASATRLAE